MTIYRVTDKGMFSFTDNKNENFMLNGFTIWPLVTDAQLTSWMSEQNQKSDFSLTNRNFSLKNKNITFILWNLFC